MPIGEIVGEIVGQIVMEAGGEVIHRKFGWIGCLVAIATPILVILLAIWLLK